MHYPRKDDPTPEEIAELCLEIQQRWSLRERRARQVGMLVGESGTRIASLREAAQTGLWELPVLSSPLIDNEVI